MSVKTEIVLGQPSWHVASDLVEAWVTEAGAHLAPVVFTLNGVKVQPFHIAPWHDEEVEAPPIIQTLRGDFFCLPFGANETQYGDEAHPVHGETANSRWSQVEPGMFEMETTIRQGKVRRQIELVNGEANIYVRNIVSGMSGPTCFGNHAMLAFPSTGLVSTSPFQFGQVFPGDFELPANGGYSSLKPGAIFQRLEVVPMDNGRVADLSEYPAREGFEDLVMLIGDDNLPFAWNAVVFPKQGYLWFCLRNPRVLRHTILWHSNGGRHYAPWNGRHRRVLGIEDVTAYFHYGLAESCSPNPLSDQGIATSLYLDPGTPLRVSTIMGVASVGPDAEHVEAIEPGADGVEIRLRSGESISIPINLDWLY